MRFIRNLFASPPAADLDDRAFRAWLRAGSPDLGWFLAQTLEDQEAMALLGDEHRADTAIAFGAAVRDLEGAAAAAAMIGGEEPSELERVKAAAVNAARMTMGGVAERREQAANDRQRLRNRGRSLMGHPPAEV